jgi:hypothetical protein
MIEATVGAETAADVDAKWLHLCDRLSYIQRVQSACQINRHTHGVANLSADRPVVRAAGATQLLGGEGWIPGIEKNGVHVG